MVETKSIQDPLGNDVLISPIISNHTLTLYEIRKVIKTPAFIIQEGEEVLYYFKLLTKNTNLLVKAHRTESYFILKGYEVNPDTTYISDLLLRGKIIFFE